MKIISTNIAQARKILWNGNTIETGIFKYPVTPPILLGKEDVDNDHVIDRRYHGGVDKACYLYSADHYPFWQAKYPHLEWDYGMFGENLTIEGMDESEMLVGDVYRIGGAVVQVAQPRQPCFKLGIRFGDQRMLKEFIDASMPGIYLRVLEEGKVSIGDELVLEDRTEGAISIADLYRLLYNKNADPKALELAIATPHLAVSARNSLEKRLGLVSSKS